MGNETLILMGYYLWGVVFQTTIFNPPTSCNCVWIQLSIGMK